MERKVQDVQQSAQAKTEQAINFNVSDMNNVLSILNSISIKGADALSFANALNILLTKGKIQ